ncbi:MAG: DUF1501 domain-containing protein [Pirellulales bacterium]|nr:DUF1501 domain-containing protein [Pirellulales bacterium]
MSSFPRHAAHAFASLLPREREGLVVVGRRSVLKASVAGLAGLTLPALLARRAGAAPAPAAPRGKSVILLWMTGGPSHIDTWDMKPLAPVEIRGPFGAIDTALPGVQICEHLPKQAAMLDRMTLIRSVDAQFSNHEPNQVFQTANLAAEPRINPEAPKYPAIGALASKILGPRDPALPPYVVLNMQDRSHVAWGGYLGQQFDPFDGRRIDNIVRLPTGIVHERLATRRDLRQQLDRLRRDLDRSGMMTALDRFEQQAVDLVAGQRAREAFDVGRESPTVLEKYGEHPWCRQALLARRLVEAGVAFVTIDLSNHTASGTWDNHGDNIPPYGGISRGLKPLLPVFDHLLTTLVTDLTERGLIDDVLVLAMGEFGRTPQIGTQGSTDGRNHWQPVMSMTVAGGGLRHGQVIGASDRIGGEIKERPVTPGDLAATIYRHLGVPLDSSYLDFRGRPRPIIEQGSPIVELG